ncbi:MAG TPA: CHAT domain-containing protein, partial [Dongiaceae bacterium]|nr:CHAT domain-containing protein [Dongiaceae bacterium]
DPRLAEGPRPGGGDAGLDRAARAVGDALRQAVWDPIAERLGGAALLLVVTDGALQQISLATLPDRGDRFVIDTTPPIHYLGAERDLVRLRAPAPRGRGALFVGGVDFDAPARAATDRGPSEARPPAPERFDPLPGTRAEVETLRTLRPDAESPELLTGAAATTAAFRALAPGRRLLHLATHAWFMGTAGAPSILADRRLLSSGVAFAGANRPGGDGILIADQIAALDLSAAEWVVLSACDTGSGHLLGSEGVIGLRRAFERAGARTVVTSLWPADDGAARLWMRALYDARAAGRSTPDAVRDASLQILEQARRSGRTPHPYYWGAFVAAGDWR